VVKKLEEFMASNGLVANPTKTVFMMLNNNKKEKKEVEKSQWETIKLKNQNQQNFLVW